MWRWREGIERNSLQVGTVTNKYPPCVTFLRQKLCRTEIQYGLVVWVRWLHAYWQFRHCIFQGRTQNGESKGVVCTWRMWQTRASKRKECAGHLHVLPWMCKRRGTVWKNRHHVLWSFGLTQRSLFVAKLLRLVWWVGNQNFEMHVLVSYLYDEGKEKGNHWGPLSWYTFQIRVIWQCLRKNIGKMEPQHSFAQ